MAKRLFVGGLPYSVTDDELQNMFVQFGNVVSAKVIIDKFSGRSKGFGFVEMDNDEEADKAIESLNGSDVGGRKIAVNVARPMEERPPRQFDNRGGFDNNRGGFRRDNNRSRGGGRRY